MVAVGHEKDPESIWIFMASLSHYLQGFSTIPGGFIAGFLNHQRGAPTQSRATALDGQLWISCLLEMQNGRTWDEKS